MKVLIVGGGIAGLTLAAFLEDSNIEYKIVEKQTTWNVSGFSIGMWSNGRSILKKLGLAEKFDTEGKRVLWYRICDGAGRELRAYNLSHFYARYGTAYTHVRRKHLHDWLLDKVDPSKIRLNTFVVSLKQTDDVVVVALSTGESESYDLVVGADGVHSTVRSLIFRTIREKYDNCRVWYTWFDAQYKKEATVTEYIEPGIFVSVFDDGDKALAVLIAPQKHAIWDSEEGRVERLRTLFKDVSLASEALTNIRDSSVVPTDLSHIELQQWVQGRVVLMGDAAHGFEPHAGLGGSMALEDAYVLAAELMKISPEHLLKDALATYQNQRKERVNLARRLTRHMSVWTTIRPTMFKYFIHMCISFAPAYFFTRDYTRLFKEEYH